MSNEFPTSLYPDSEQRLYEKLANSKEEQAELDNIRCMMKAILGDEQRERMENSKP